MIGSVGKYINGFRLLNPLTHGVNHLGVANGAAIRRNYCVGYSSGYMAEITSLQESGTKVALGIAQHTNTVGEASSAGAVTGEYIPVLSNYRWMVPVEQNAAITAAAIGTIVDLQSANTIDIGDLVTLGLGFVIDDIDISAPALAANTYGYAIGHFAYVAAS